MLPHSCWVEPMAASRLQLMRSQHLWCRPLLPQGRAAYSTQDHLLPPTHLELGLLPGCLLLLPADARQACLLCCPAHVGGQLEGARSHVAGPLGRANIVLLLLGLGPSRPLHGAVRRGGGG